MTKIIEGNSTAWLTRNSHLGPEDIRDADPDDFTFTRPDLDMSSSGWVKMGTAHIRIELIDQEFWTGAKIEAIEAEIEALVVSTEARVNILKGQIQSLKAITYQPTDEAE